MTLGQRIKAVRLEKGLSQRQLCGSEITRNMLSQIENGNAKPSMATLTYLARKLEKPVSFFLEETVPVIPSLPPALAEARNAYAADEFSRVVTLLQDLPEGDFSAETHLLLALSRMELAKKALAQKKNLFAENLLLKAAEDGAKTPYFTNALERQRLLLLYEVTPTAATKLLPLLQQDERELLLRAQTALDVGNAARCIRILEGAENLSKQWQLLRGLSAMALKDYSTAIACLTQAEAVFPQECIPALETCYRETEDFKMAYLYACKQK